MIQGAAPRQAHRLIAACAAQARLINSYEQRGREADGWHHDGAA